MGKIAQLEMLSSTSSRLSAVSRFLAQAQEDGLTGKALAAMVRHAARLCGGLLLYLDDAESLQIAVGEGQPGQWRDDEVSTFWELLANEAESYGSFGLLASCRYAPPGLDEKSTLSLPAMREVDVVRILSWLPTLGQLHTADRSWVAEKVDGHPRTIEYLEALAERRSRDVASEKHDPTGGYQGDNWRADVLEARTQVLGEEHPDTLVSMNNLAATLFAQGDLAGAQRFHEKALDAMTRVLGEEHHHTLAGMHNLANTHYAQGDLAGARRLQEKVLTVVSRVLGERHEHTTACQWNLLNTLLQGQVEAAVVLLQKMRWLFETPADQLSAMQRQIRDRLRQLFGRKPYDG